MLKIPTLVSGQSPVMVNGESGVPYAGPVTISLPSGFGLGTVTSVGISGTNGISVVSGSPITTSGTIALAVNYNTTNLKVTASQLNTIQDINSTAEPTFTRLNLNPVGSGGILINQQIGGTPADITFANSGTTKWVVKNSASNTFQVEDNAGNYVFTIYPTTRYAYFASRTSFGITDGTSLSNPLSVGTGSSINFTVTTAGAVTAGAWQATKIGLVYGGTNADLSATGGTGQYLKQSSVGASITVGTIPASDIASGAALEKTDDTNVTLTLGGSPTTSLLAATSLTLGWTGQLGLTRGGTNASLTASNGGIVYSTASAMDVLSGTATAGQIIRSGSNAAPSWSTATFSSTYAASSILYSNGANTVTGLATANNGVLITSGTGVPSISSSLPSAVQNNIVALNQSASFVAESWQANSGFVTLDLKFQAYGGGQVICGPLSLWDVPKLKTVSISIGSTLTADRTLSLVTGDASRVLTLSGNATLDQPVATTSSPQFAKVGLGVAASNNQLSITGKASIGYGDTSAPTDGLIVSGKTGINTNSVAATNYINFGGTWSQAATSQFFYVNPNITVSSSFSALSHVYFNPTITVAASQTLTNGANLNLGTGTASLGASAAITNGYNLYCPQPAFGTNAYAAFFGPRVGFNDVAPTATVSINGAATSAQGSGTARTAYVYSVDGLTASANSATLMGLSVGSLKFLTGSSTGLTASALDIKVSDASKTGIGTIDNAYALRIQDSWASVATNKYSLYNASTDLSYFAGTVNIATTSSDPSTLLYINGTLTSTTAGYAYPLIVTTTINPTLGATGEIRCISAQPTVIAPSTKTISYATGIYANVNVSTNVGTITNLYGIKSEMGSSGAGTITNSYGLSVSRPVPGTNRYTAYFDQVVGIGVTPVADRIFYIGGSFLSTSDVFGQVISAQLGASSGTLANAHQFYLYPNYGGNAGTVTSAAGIYVDTGATAGTITTGYGIYVQAIGYGTTRYGMYVNVPTGGTNNYCALFTGNVSIGTTSGASDRQLQVTGTIRQSSGDVYGITSTGSLGANTSTTVNNAAHFYAYPNFGANNGTTSNAFGLKVDSGVSGGTITNGFGIYIAPPSFGTNKWSLYVDHSSGNCAYFEGNSAFFQSPSYGGGTKVIFLGNRSAAPTSNPTNGTILYAESGAFKARGSSGTVTTIANAEPHCPVCGKDYGLERDSEKYEYFHVCMPCLVDLIEAKFGKQKWVQRGKTRLLH